MPKIELSKKAYNHLKNIMVWADLYDKEKNGSKNAKVFDAIIKDWDYLGGENVKK